MEETRTYSTFLHCLNCGCEQIVDVPFGTPIHKDINWEYYYIDNRQYLVSGKACLPEQAEIKRYFDCSNCGAGRLTK